MLKKISIKHVSYLLMLSACAVAQASDIDVFGVARDKKPVITLLLDTSGSMGAGNYCCQSIELDYKDGEIIEPQPAGYPKTSSGKVVYRIRKAVNVAQLRVSPTQSPRNTSTTYLTKSNTFRINGVDKQFSNLIAVKGGQNGTGIDTYNVDATQNADGTFTEVAGTRSSNYKHVYYDRLSRVKIAIGELLQDPIDPNPSNPAIGLQGAGNTKEEQKKISDKLNRVKVALATFSSATGSNDADGKTGVIRLAAVDLSDLNNRTLLFDEVNKLFEYHGTPTLAAYAEVVAYMVGSKVNMDGDFFGFSRSSALNKPTNPTVQNSLYLRPINNCTGHGIFLLTDGGPNAHSTSFSSTQREKVAKSAIGSSATSASFKCESSTLTGDNFLPELFGDGSSPTGWACIGNLAKEIRQEVLSSNKIDLQYGRNGILTAVVGFGNVATMASFNSNGQCLPSKTNRRNNALKQPDTQNAGNLCELGNESDDYGKGGFTKTGSSRGMADALIKLIDKIPPVSISIASGRIVMPVDPYQQSQRILTPYMPMTLYGNEPLTTNYGNLKRFWLNTEDFTYEGKGQSLTLKSLFWQPTDDGGKKAGQMRPDVQDDWYIAGIQSSLDSRPLRRGGVSDRLWDKYYRAAPPSARKVFLEEGAQGVAYPNSVTLTELKPTATLLDNPTAPITATATKDAKTVARYLFNYLGYNLDVDNTTTKYTDATLNALLNENNIRFMGGLYHAEPIVVPREGVYQKGVFVESSRMFDIWFGSSEGGLHLVNGVTGAHKYTVLPRAMLENQLDALKPETKGSLKYGADGLWALDFETSKTKSAENEIVKTKKAVVYGGLRMGGTGVYAFDVTSSEQPKKLWSIYKGKNSYLNNLGQSWAKPVVTKIWWKGVLRKVLIVTGGYDMCYENDPAAVAGKTCATQADGNAIFVINLEKLGSIDKSPDLTSYNAGDVLMKFSNASTLNASAHTEMKDSIVAEPAVFDAFGDGTADALYFGDLGGKLWRIDFDNNAHRSKGASSTWPTEAPAPVLLANLVDSSNGNFVPRLYATPTVTFQRLGNVPVLMVTVGSGNRSLPNDVLPPENGGISYKATGENGIFALYDFDVLSPNVLNSNQRITKDIKLTNLVKAPSTQKAMYEAIFNADLTVNKKGWYRLFTPSQLSIIDTDSGVVSTPSSTSLLSTKKVLSPMVARNNILFANVYDAAIVKTSNYRCSQYRGESYNEIHCLPYGTCAKTTADITFATKGQSIKVGNDTLTAKTTGLGVGDTGSFVKVKRSKDTTEGLTGGISTGVAFTSGKGNNNVPMTLRWFRKYADPS